MSTPTVVVVASADVLIAVANPRRVHERNVNAPSVIVVPVPAFPRDTEPPSRLAGEIDSRSRSIYIWARFSLSGHSNQRQPNVLPEIASLLGSPTCCVRLLRC